ncbi:MAG: nuclear transport factor 2 family protein [Chloroflexi bacterium]|nr:MAG: nuclear transport factor 2 family protein [Chloroflexota bacterium]
MTTIQTIQLVKRFNDALNARDVDGMMALMHPACIFENTYPPPDGARFVGQEAVRGFWLDFFAGSSQAAIEIEEIAAWEDRCVMRWVYRWRNPQAESGHIRGIDLYTVADGLISQKLSYVKG